MGLIQLHRSVLNAFVLRMRAQSLRRAPSEAAESGGSRCQHEEGTRQAVRPHVYALVGVPEGACSEALHHQVRRGGRRPWHKCMEVWAGRGAG